MLIAEATFRLTLWGMRDILGLPEVARLTRGAAAAKKFLPRIEQHCLVSALLTTAEIEAAHIEAATRAIRLAEAEAGAASCAILN